MEAEATPVISGKDLQTVFKSFDKDNSGTIELTELRSVITQMGETVTEKELAKMLKDMDTNNDGKISYPEFEYWWKFGHKGKLKKVVALKFKALKLIHQANEKLTKSNVKLKEQYTGELSSYEISVGLGDEAANIEVSLQACLMGELYTTTFELLKKQVPNLSNKGITILFSFDTKNAAEGKTKVDEMLDIFKKESAQGTVMFEIFSLFHIESVVTGNTLTILLNPRIGNTPVEEPMENVNQVINSLGKEFSLKVSGSAKLRGSITEAFSTMKFVKWISQGFNATFKIETNAGLVKNLRKLLEAMTDASDPGFMVVMLLTLLNTAKLNLKFRAPENVDKFFESLGIGQLSEESPNFGELLEELSNDFNMASWKEPNNPKYPLFQVFKFLMENVDDSLRIDIVLPFLVLRTQLKCIGGSYLFNTAFKSSPAPSASK